MRVLVPLGLAGAAAQAVGLLAALVGAGETGPSTAAWVQVWKPQMGQTIQGAGSRWRVRGRLGMAVRTRFRNRRVVE